MKKFLGNFSPAYGIMTGEGEMGKMAKKGMMGLLPRMIAKGATQEEEEEMKRAQAEGRAMKKGGKVNGFRDGGIYTADMGQPPQDIDGGSAPPKKPALPLKKLLTPKQSDAARDEARKRLSETARGTPSKIKGNAMIRTRKDKEPKEYAKGGSIDGIAQRGKTNCKMR
jgi:hypothetical protein